MCKIHRIVCGNGNCYIVEGGDGAVLVDTGKREYLEKVLAACRPYKIRLLLLTHGHFDHAENAAAIAQALGVPIAMHPDDRNLIAGNERQPLSARTLPGKLVLAVSRRDFARRAMRPWTPDVLLRGGEGLAEYGVDAQVLALPGHTDGSIGVDTGRDLLPGDALMNLFYPTVSMLYRDRAAMLQSAANIAALGPRTVWFGHGGPVPNRQWV